MQQLDFDESLLDCRTNSDLSAKLKELRNKLSHLAQDNVDKQSLESVRSQLIQSRMIQHKDKGIRILVACCCSDLLRLYAPDPPFDEREIKTLFTLFFKQLQGIGDPKGPFFSDYYYLLDSICTVRSVTLLADMNCDQMIVDLFADFFEMISSDMSPSVTICLLEVMQQLVDECSSLPMPVVEILMRQFEKKQQNRNPAAFKLACELCSATSDKLQRYVCQYFSDIIIASSEITDDDELADFKAAHSLVLQINKSVPALLLNVIPLLEEELKVENLIIRRFATTSLGEMYVESGHRLIEQYASTWQAWRDRRNDKAPTIRVVWAEYVYFIVEKHPELLQLMEPDLTHKIMDPDEKVRVAIVNTIGKLSEGLHPVSDSCFRAVGNRCRDRKMQVRTESMRVLSRLFQKLYTKAVAADGDFSAIEPFLWIPSQIVELLYLGDAEMTIMVEKALHEFILPPNLNDGVRTERLMEIVSVFSEKQYLAFLSVLQRQATTIKDFSYFIDQCQRYNGGIMDAESEEITDALNQIMDHLATKVPESRKPVQHLQKFAEINNSRLYQIIRNIMNPATDFKSILKYNKEIATRLEKHPQVYETLAVFLRRISLTLVPKESGSQLLELIERASASHDTKEILFGSTAERLVEDCAKLFPTFFRAEKEQLIKMFVSGQDQQLVTDALRALSKLISSDPTECPKEQSIVDRLLEKCMNGTSKQAKYAALVLVHGGFKKELEKLLQTIVDELDNIPTIVPRLSTLRVLAQKIPTVYQTFAQRISTFCVDLLSVGTDNQSESDANWIEFHDLEFEGQSKVLAFQVLAAPLLIQDQTQKDGLLGSVLELIKKCLGQEGELGQGTDPVVKTHLRLQAGKIYLKLQETVQDVGDFELYKLVGLLVQDPVYQVRDVILTKLCKAMSLQLLPVKFAPYLCMVAHDPEDDLKAKASSMLLRLTKPNENMEASIEFSFVRAMHLLAHHPDFTEEEEDLQQFEAYINFFLDSVCNGDNVSYLYHMSGQLKLVKDKHAEQSRPLYVLCELAQLLMQRRAASHNWVLQAYPDKVGLPRDLFERLDKDEGNKTLKTKFLGDNIVGKTKANRTPSKPTRQRTISEESDLSTISRSTRTKRKSTFQPSPSTSPKSRPRRSVYKPVYLEED
ncbi:armadillo-type protein [Gorgonomyces haynaldii]|nr:armadillo-type protein [Gorgonomyces haynaldii]